MYETAVYYMSDDAFARISTNEMEKLGAQDGRGTSAGSPHSVRKRELSCCAVSQALPQAEPAAPDVRGTTSEGSREAVGLPS